ncbi:MAG: hypothetical protein R6U13_16315 [Desulfatiglandaceae bacterium]
MSIKNHRMTAVTAVAACLVLAHFVPCFAGTFLEMQPGVSTRADADSALGPPIREVVPGIRYDYRPQLDSRRLTLTFHEGTGVIESIDIYSEEPYSKVQYQEWLQLGRADRRDYDDRGNLVEYFPAAGVALHFSGQDEVSMVEFLRYFDPSSSTDPLKDNSAEVSKAVVLFEDNFDLENEGRGSLSFSAFSNWNVVDGTVDLIGLGFFDYFPDLGLYVDLDGSTSKAGTLVSKEALDLARGSYLLAFDLAGNPRSGPNTVTVRVGDLFSREITLAMKEPPAHFEFEIHTTRETKANIFFEHEGGDNFGNILDNVSFTRLIKQEIPEPSGGMDFDDDVQNVNTNFVIEAGSDDKSPDNPYMVQGDLDSAYAWVKIGAEQGFFVFRELQKLPAIENLKAIAAKTGREQVAEKYARLFGEIDENIQKALETYSDSFRELGGINRTAVDAGLRKYHDFLRDHDASEQLRILDVVERQLYCYLENRKPDREGWRREFGEIARR